MNEPRPSPKATDEDRLSFSLSEDEAENTHDSLDIKPPQAAVLHRKPNRHKKDKIQQRDVKQGYRKSHHPRSDERRKEYKPERAPKERGDFHHKDSQKRSDHRDKKVRERSDRVYGRSKKDGAPLREGRSAPEKRQSKDPNVVETPKTEGDQLLDDLRGKLIEKRMRDTKIESEPEIKRQKKDRRERPEKEKIEEVPMETEKEREERLQREERKAKLIEAEREMAMRKEVSRRELEARRERHNLEKEKHRMLKEIARKHKMEKEIQNKSDGEDGEIAEKSDDEANNEDDDDSDSSSSSSSDDSTDKEDSEDQTKAETPESAPPLEKSPRTPEGHPPSRGSSREITPEARRSRDRSEEPMEAAPDYYKDESPKSDIVMKESLPPYLPAIQGCRSVEEFQCLNRIEEGTYGVVYRARDKRTSDIVALKRLKMEKEKEGFPITSLREINTLLKAQHPNIVTVREIVVGSNMDKIFIVMDYVEHDLKSLMETMKSKKQVFVPGEIKCLMLQLLRAVSHLHDNWILHRDLKTSNLLLSHKGILKVGDFGLAREYGSPLKAYTPIVVTLWYRAPELLLQAKEYTTAIDVWSVGCIFGELLQMEALFSGRSEMDQLNRIFKELGTPNEKVWPGCSKLPAFQKVTFADYPVNQIKNRFGSMLSDLGISLMNSFLTYDPAQRVTAEDALKHDYFKEAPLPIDPAMFPTWPAKSEQGIKKANNSPKPPSGGKEYKQLGDTDELPSGGFHMGAMERRTHNLGPGFSLKF